MDPSALIFVALAVAWAAYLIPKALHHHEEAARSRSVDRFSDTMRVLARREPADARSARLVVTPGRPAAASVVTKPRAAAAPAEVAEGAAAPARRRAPTSATARPEAGSAPSRREAANRAARRRRRVLLGVLAVNLVVAGLAAFSVIAWWWVAAPVALLVAWLVACRLMVKRESRVPASRATSPAVAEQPAAPTVAPIDDAETGPMQRVEDQPPVALPLTDPTLWDPVPVTLPTYVTKPAASRTVRTIDLDSTGVWTSGRTEADAQIARDAEAADRAARAAQDDAERAVGS